MALMLRLRSALAAGAAVLVHQRTLSSVKADALLKDLNAALKEPDSKVAVEKATKIVESLSVAVLKKEMTVEQRVTTLEVKNEQANQSSNFTNAFLIVTLIFVFTSIDELRVNHKVAELKIEIRFRHPEESSCSCTEGPTVPEKSAGPTQETSGEDDPSSSTPQEPKDGYWIISAVKRMFGYWM